MAVDGRWTQQALTLTPESKKCPLTISPLTMFCRQSSDATSSRCSWPVCSTKEPSQQASPGVQQEVAKAHAPLDGSFIGMDDFERFLRPGVFSLLVPCDWLFSFVIGLVFVLLILAVFEILTFDDFRFVSIPVWSFLSLTLSLVFAAWRLTSWLCLRFLFSPGCRIVGSVLELLTCIYLHLALYLY